MDKETLAGYGWLVVTILVLSIMIGLATPFATAIKGNFIGVVNRLTSEASEAFGVVDGNIVDNGGGGSGGMAEDPIQMLDGGGQEYDLADAQMLTFRTSAPYDSFKEVKVDNEIVDPDNYTVTEGSTIVTFNEEYSKTLSVGEHLIEIVSTGGEVSAEFTVVNTSGSGSTEFVPSISGKPTPDVPGSDSGSSSGSGPNEFVPSIGIKDEPTLIP